MNSEKEFQNFELLDSDWNRIEELLNFLKDFHTATNHVSGTRYPTLSLVMPIYGCLLKKLNVTIRQSQGLMKQICAAALNKLEKYHTLMETEVYWISMVLNPSLKLDVFKERYSKDVCKQIKTTVINVFSSFYEESGPDDGNESNAARTSEDIVADDDLLAFYPKRSKKQAKGSEMNKYLSADLAPPFTSVLEWWKKHEEDYKKVARMACDYLAIPGTSVPVERAFSTGADIVTPKRGSLHPETITALTCLKNWWK